MTAAVATVETGASAVAAAELAVAASQHQQFVALFVAAAAFVALAALVVVAETLPWAVAVAVETLPAVVQGSRQFVVDTVADTDTVVL